MKVKENLETKEQLRLVAAVLTICINFFTELKLTSWGNSHGTLQIPSLLCRDLVH